MSKIELRPNHQHRTPAKDCERAGIKDLLRQEAAQRLAALSVAGRTQASAAVVHLLRQSLFHDAGAKMALLFAPLPDEPDVQGLMECATGHWYFPGLQADHIVLLPFEHGVTRWHTGAHGVREPDTSPVGVPLNLDLVLVPGRGFAPDGTRLGRGGGHYDRFLSKLPASCLRVGVCFDCQIFDTLPREPHDFPVHQIITECRFIACETSD